MRSSGAQTSRLYGLSKVGKNEIFLRLVLSVPVKGYYNLNEVLAANIETSTPDARRNLESLKLGPDEIIIYLEAKSLYTNVPVNEATEITLRSQYSSEHAPEMSRSTFKAILKPAVTNICFKCKDRLIFQMDGLEMGASFAVALANIWMKSFENQNKSTKEIINTIPKKDHDAGSESNRRITYRGK